MSEPIVNSHRLVGRPGEYYVIDRFLDREATVKSVSAASAITRYLNLCQPGHPAIDAPIESIMAGEYAMTVTA